MLQTRINAGFTKHFCLFKLNRSRWLTGQIIEYSIHPTHLIDNPAHYRLQHLERDLRRLRGHEIHRIHGAQCNCIIIGSLIPHDSDASHIGERRKILTDRTVQSGFRNLLAVDGISVLHNADFLCRHLADDADAESRSRERLAEYQILRNAKLKACLTHLILEQIAQRLDDLLEINIVRQTSDIVV